MFDAAPDVIGKLVGIGLRHDRSHVPHELLHAVGIFIDDIALAHEMDFEQVLFHKGVQNGRMGKTALEPVNAIDHQGRTLLLLADEFDHLLEFRAMAFGRAFDDTKDLHDFKLTASRVFLEIGKLCLKRMTGFLFGTGYTGENDGWAHMGLLFLDISNQEAIERQGQYTPTGF
ncbi:MAG: hypothetical protein WDO70_06065 [Alphaproteobacteria bacterium]